MTFSDVFFSLQRSKICNTSISGLFEVRGLTCVTCCASHCDNFHQLRTPLTYPLLNYNVFTADSLRHAVTLTIEPLTLNVCNLLAVV